jgi:hypothetical protein
MVVKTRTRTGAARKTTAKAPGQRESLGTFPALLGQAIGHVMSRATVATDAKGNMTKSVRGFSIEGQYINGRADLTVKTIGDDGKPWVKKVSGRD